MSIMIYLLLFITGIFAVNSTPVSDCISQFCPQAVSEEETADYSDSLQITDLTTDENDQQEDSMEIAVQYSTIIVNSLEESVAFYRDVLGFTEGYHVDLGNGAAITIMNSAGASVELIEGAEYETGLYSIGTDVKDLDLTLQKLAEQGCEPITPIITTTVGRQAFILDPNGVRICLIEHSEAYREEYMK